MKRPPRRSARSSSRRSGASDISQLSGAKFENTPSTARPRADQVAAMSSTGPSRNSTASVRPAAASFARAVASMAGAGSQAMTRWPRSTSESASSPVPQPISRSSAAGEKWRSTARNTRARIIAMSGFAAPENMSS